MCSKNQDWWWSLLQSSFQNNVPIFSLLNVGTYNSNIHHLPTCKAHLPTYLPSALGSKWIKLTGDKLTASPAVSMGRRLSIVLSLWMCGWKIVPFMSAVGWCCFCPNPITRISHSSSLFTRDRWWYFSYKNIQWKNEEKEKKTRGGQILQNGFLQ